MDPSHFELGGLGEGDNHLHERTCVIAELLNDGFLYHRYHRLKQVSLMLPRCSLETFGHLAC